MLVLSRKVQEEITVETSDGLVRIVLIQIDRNKVRIGVEAPEGVPINRREVFDAIQRKRHAVPQETGKQAEAQVPVPAPGEAGGCQAEVV